MLNRRVKFGRKIPNRLGKMPENLGGGDLYFDLHCTYVLHILLLLLMVLEKEGELKYF